MDEEQAHELIETFYQAILAGERDEVPGLNAGLNEDAIQNAGFAIFKQLTK